MKTQMETLALGSPGCRLTLQILGFACLCNSVSWELCSTPFHFGTQAGKAVTILNIAYHCIERFPQDSDGIPMGQIDQEKALFSLTAALTTV
ncbi:uncharacterized protein LOC144382410 isoform X4 [Halichoerus grypus]